MNRVLIHTPATTNHSQPSSAIHPPEQSTCGVSLSPSFSSSVRTPSLFAVSSLPSEPISSHLTVALATSFRARSTLLCEVTGPLRHRSFKHDFVPRDPNAKPKKYKYPAFYNPYGPRLPPSEKIIQLAERIVAFAPEERCQIGPALAQKLTLPKLQHISTEGMDLGAQAGPGGAGVKAEEKKEEKTVFDVKLEKFDASTKVKVIKEVRAFTALGLKEAKDLVEKVRVLIKQGVTKEEAASIIEKIKAAGGVATME